MSWLQALDATNAFELAHMPPAPERKKGGNRIILQKTRQLSAMRALLLWRGTASRSRKRRLLALRSGIATRSAGKLDAWVEQSDPEAYPGNTRNKKGILATSCRFSQKKNTKKKRPIRSSALGSFAGWTKLLSRRMRDEGWRRVGLVLHLGPP